MTGEGARGFPLAPVLDSIPEGLRQLPAVTWKSIPAGEGEKPRKLPCDPKTGAAASSTDPATWATLAEASARYRRGGYAGVGAALTEAAAVVAIDLDGAGDYETGHIEPWAREIVAKIPTYWEWSPNGKGLHGYAYGRLPVAGRRTGQVELYQAKRFITITGRPLGGSEADVRMCIPQIAALYDELFPESPAPAPEPRRPSPVDDLDDRALLGRMFKFNPSSRTLWDGGSTNGGDHSADDLALVNHILWITGNDPDRSDRLFRQSGQMRPKWDERRGELTYGQRTITKALQDAGPGYTGTPAGGNGRHAEAQKQQFASSEGDCDCARVAELEAKVAEQAAEIDRLRAIFSGVHGILERGGTPDEKMVALGTNFVIFADPTDENGWVTVTQGALAARFNTSKATVGRVLHDKGRLCGPSGTIEKRVSRAPVLDENGEQAYDDKGQARWESTMMLRPRAQALQMSLHETAIRLPKDRNKRAPNRTKDPAPDLTPFTGEQLLAALPEAEFTCPHCGTVDCADLHITVTCRVEACGGLIAEVGQKPQFASSEPAPAPTPPNVVDVANGSQFAVSAPPSPPNGNGNGHKFDRAAYWAAINAGLPGDEARRRATVGASP